VIRKKVVAKEKVRVRFAHLCPFPISALAMGIQLRKKVEMAN
jgi:hypothetical protein